MTLRHSVFCGHARKSLSLSSRSLLAIICSVFDSAPSLDSFFSLCLHSHSFPSMVPFPLCLYLYLAVARRHGGRRLLHRTNTSTAKKMSSCHHRNGDTSCTYPIRAFNLRRCVRIRAAPQVLNLNPPARATPSRTSNTDFKWKPARTRPAQQKFERYTCTSFDHKCDDP